jgi:hypothetical protein
MTSIVEVHRQWRTRYDCIEHLEAIRRGESPIYPYCGAECVSHNRYQTRGRTARWQWPIALGRTEKWQG